MRRKRIVSSIAALAMAASAFAGMAVTASAEDTVVFNNDCSAIDGWAAESGSVEVKTDGSESYISCYGSGSGNRVARYSFPESVTGITEGDLKLSFDFYFSDNFGVADRSVAIVSIDGIWSLTSTTWSGTRNDKYYTSDNTEETFDVPSKVWYTVDAALDMDTKTATVIVSNRDTNAQICVSENVAFTDGLSTLMIQSPRYGNTRETYVDNISVIQPEEPIVSATDVVINYKNGDSVIKNISETLEGKFSGDDYSYSYPAYVQGEDGAWYKATNTTYTQTVELAGGTTTIDVPYTPADDVVGFAEGEAINDNDIKSSSALSGGSGARVPEEGASICTISESGIYKITVVAYCRNTRNESVYSVYKNSVAEENVIGSGDAKEHSQNVPFVGVSENIELNAGETVILAGDEGNTGIDYIVVQKTGDIQPEPSPTPTVEKSITRVDAQTEYEGSAAVSYMAKFDVTGSLGVNGITWTITGAGEKLGESKPVSDTFENPTTVTDGAIVFGLVIEAQSGLDTIGSVDAELQ